MDAEKSKIYVFRYNLNSQLCIAMAEDGSALQGHLCADENHAPSDLGMVPGIRSHRHDAYAKKYPDGYELVFVPAEESASNVAFMEAFTAHMNRIAAGDFCGMPEVKADAHKHLTHFAGAEAS